MEEKEQNLLYQATSVASAGSGRDSVKVKSNRFNWYKQ